jgi:hypothetical protein
MKAPFEVGGAFPPPFVILSVERPDRLPETNAERTKDLDALIKDVPFAFRTEGCYNGTHEASRLVMCDFGDTIFTQLERIAHRYGQESMLYVDERGAASYIITADNENRYMRWPAGKWRALSPTESLQLKSWTRDIKGNYYAAT